MAFKATTFSVPQSPQPDILTISNFKGINVLGADTEIDISESPDMKNIVIDQFGRLDERFGYKRAFATSLGAGQVNGVYRFKKQDGTIFSFLHWGTNLYTCVLDGVTQPASIYSSLANAKSSFVTFGNYCYILDGTNFVRTDGVTTVDVSTVAYVPTLTLGRAPTGGGTANENFNLLGAGFKDSFTQTGTATAFQLSLTSLDATLVTAVVNGVAKVETTDFTVVRSTGVVTFTIAPAVGTANNVVITAYKTPTGYAGRIKNSTGMAVYGGTNDTRVFWFGNASYNNFLRRSGLNDPTYAPELGYNLIGSDAGIIKGMTKHYNDAIIVKEPIPNQTTVFLMSYSMDTSGNVTFPTLPLNSTGCTAAGSIQILDDNPVYFGPNGINRLSNTYVSSQRDVTRISDRVNLLLLAEATPSAAVSATYNYKYILAVNNNAYVYDYRLDVWYLWDNITASCFVEMDGYLYFGSNTMGMLYRFKTAKDTLPYDDDGVAINCYWKSKVMSFDDDMHQKNVPKVTFMLKPNSRASADLYYVTDRINEQFVTTTRVDLFDYTLWDYSNFTYALSSFPQPGVGKIKAKKLIYIQFILRQPRVDESMGILSMSIQHQQGRLLK